MKKLLFFSLATVAILFAACKENEPGVTNNYYTTNNTYNNVTPASNLIPGELPGEFSVSISKRVHFSQGNLQYNAKQNFWRFAEHQYDTIGAGNKNISATYDGYIDLFGWGTSGYNGKNPWMTSTTDTDYGNGRNDLAGTEYDWGVYNAIRNGGNETNLWRTLTGDEWLYLFHERANAQKLFALGSVDGLNGAILLPDGWILPEGITFNPSTENGLGWNGSTYHNYTSGADNFKDNAYTLEEWAKMEANGAVFLPAAGYRNGTNARIVGTWGGYWAITTYDATTAYFVLSSSDELRPKGSNYRHYGYCIRLVR